MFLDAGPAALVPEGAVSGHRTYSFFRSERRPRLEWGSVSQKNGVLSCWRNLPPAACLQPSLTQSHSPAGAAAPPSLPWPRNPVLSWNIIPEIKFRRTLWVFFSYSEMELWICNISCHETCQATSCSWLRVWWGACPTCTFHTTANEDNETCASLMRKCLSDAVTKE